MPPKSLTHTALQYVAPVLCAAAAAAQAQVGDVSHVHDPAIIKQGDTYYLFATGRGIPVRTSPDLIHWTIAKPVFAAMPEWAVQNYPKARDIWAPDITFTNGEYRLYYAVSIYGTEESAIGLATNATLDPADPRFGWKDHGIVVSTRPHDNWNAIDPAAFTDADGHTWLAAGSYWSGIKLFKVDAATGQIVKGDPARSIAQRHGDTALEAAFITHRDGWYYLWVSFDHCCQGAKSNYNVRVGRSRKVDGPYVDAAGKPMLDGGGTIVLESNGNVRGPGHCAVLHDKDASGAEHDYLVHHWYDAAENGMRKLGIRPITWDAAGWPHAGDPLATTIAPSGK